MNNIWTVITFLALGVMWAQVRLSPEIARLSMPLALLGLAVWYIYFRPLKSYEAQMRGVKKLQGKAGSAHGSANFAGSGELKKANLSTGKGFILGKFNNSFIRFNTPGHLITFAPTRSGKGVGQVIPNLLDHPGSVVVNDIKGENFAVSGRHREAFSQVVSFAPFGESSACYNPIDSIRVGTHDELDDAALIADMIIIDEGSSDPFWNREARNLVTALILHVAHDSPAALRTLGEMRVLLMQNKTDFETTVRRMLKSNCDFVRRAAGALAATEAKILSNVLSTAKSQTAVWDSPRLQAITGKSDFKLEEIKQRSISLYIIIPPEYLDVYKPVVRLMMGLTLTAMTRTKGKPAHPVLFLIDEFPALGYMRNIEVGIGYLAGYGVSLWLFIQDLNQLKDNYPKWGTFLSNCAVRVAFGTNDVETAKVLSDMLGTTTIRVESSGVSRNDSGKSKSESYSETSRSLMTPDEVMRMPNDAQLIFVQGAKPIVAEKIQYFADPFFKGKFDRWGG